MVRNARHALIVAGSQPSPETVVPPATLTNRQCAPSVTPKPPQQFNRKRQPCPTCQKANCHNGDLCRNDHTSSAWDSTPIPTNVTRRPSVRDNHREGPSQHPPANRTLSLSLATDLLTSPTVPRKPHKSGTMRKVSDPLTGMPKRSPSRTGAPTVSPRSEQKRATSRPPAYEQDLTPQQSPPRQRPHCWDWLKGNCPKGSNCCFTHDPAARPAEELCLKKAAEDQAAKAAEEQAARATEERVARAAAEKRAARAAEERAARAAEEQAARAAREAAAKEQAEKIARAAAEEHAARVAQEAVATVEETVLPSTKVTFGAGVTVQRVLTGYEACRVLVKNLPLTATRAEVVTLFTQPGFDPTKFTVHSLRGSNDRSHLEAVVEFEDAVDGENAVVGLDEIEFGSAELKLMHISKQRGMGKSKDLDSYTLTVTWPAPSNTAFATYSSMDEAQTKQTKLEKKTFNGRKIRTNIAKQPSNLPDIHWNPATISVNGLDPGASLTSIQEFCETTSIRMATRNTRNYDLNNSVSSLQSLVVEAHPEDHEPVTYEPCLVLNERGVVSVKIHFPTWEHAKVVRDFLDQKPVPLCPQTKYFVFLPDPLHYTIYVPYPQYKAQEKLFQSLIPTQNDPSATIHLRILANRPDWSARIELSGSDKKTIGRLKVRIEQLTAGEKLPQWDRVFYGAEGEKILEKVNNESQAYVRADKRQRALKAFGEPSAVEKAKTMIQEEVDRLASLQFEVPLKRASIRFFVDGARGSTLLKQEVGEENVVLDMSSIPCKIVVRGGEPARHCLNRLVAESLSDAIRSQHQLKDGEICPVCYDNIDEPDRLGCGHAYCSGCLRHFLLTASDTKQFPLLCIGDEGTCDLPIPLPVIQRFLLPTQVKRLLEVSFLDHLGHHPEKFKYCATPDCPEIYSLEADSGGGIFQCRSCFVSVCVSCGEDHEGFSCEEWKIHRDPEARERLLEGWAEENWNVKKCPKCNILIEKNGGCNHMTCPKCSVHICWRCLEVFGAGEIYDHMELAHGGMLDGDDLWGAAGW